MNLLKEDLTMIGTGAGVVKDTEHMGLAGLAGKVVLAEVVRVVGLKVGAVVIEGEVILVRNQSGEETGEEEKIIMVRDRRGAVVLVAGEKEVMVVEGMVILAAVGVLVAEEIVETGVIVVGEVVLVVGEIVVREVEKVEVIIVEEIVESEILGAVQVLEEEMVVLVAEEKVLVVKEMVDVEKIVVEGSELLKSYPQLAIKGLVYSDFLNGGI